MPISLKFLASLQHHTGQQWCTVNNSKLQNLREANFDIWLKRRSNFTVKVDCDGGQKKNNGVSRRVKRYKKCMTTKVGPSRLKFHAIFGPTRRKRNFLFVFSVCGFALLLSSYFLKKLNPCEKCEKGFALLYLPPLCFSSPFIRTKSQGRMSFLEL